MWVAVATRYSQCECGSMGKGPVDRPAPHQVIGGQTIKLAVAKKMTMDELVEYAHEHVDPALYQDIPTAIAPGPSPGYDEYKQSLVSMLGQPITAIPNFIKEWKKLGAPRAMVMRGLLGGLSKLEMNKVHVVSCVYKAAEVYALAWKTMDTKIIKDFIEFGKQGIKRSDPDSIQQSKVARHK